MLDKIRPTELLKKQKEVFLKDIKYLIKQKRNFILVNCPACNYSKYTHFLKKNSLNYVKCKKCSTVFTNPRATPKILEDFYSQSRNYQYWNKVIYPLTEKQRRKNIFKPRVDMLVGICNRLSIPKHTLIEVGCGFGTFLEELKDRKIFTRIIGIEPTPDLAETCRKKGIDIIEKPVEKVNLNNDMANIVASFEVIEHLFSPKKFIFACRKILSNKGLLFLTCPNVEGFDMQILNKASDSFDIEHLNYFNLDSLSYLLESSGFKVLEKHTPGILDAEIVRRKVLEEKFKLDNQFIESLLVKRWNTVGAAFQKFLSDNLLSSSMLIIAQKNN